MSWYPLPLKYHLVYSSPELVESRLFKSLSTQIDPTNSPLHRLMRTYGGRACAQVFRKEVASPDGQSRMLGIAKPTKMVLFEMDGLSPKRVWRQTRKAAWENEAFSGYPLIENYSHTELQSKLATIRLVVRDHWTEINARGRIHGDFTHFNVLLNDSNEITKIDERPMENSLIFDLFYFYSYLTKNVRRSRLNSSEAQRSAFIEDLSLVIREVLSSSKKSDLAEQMSRMVIPERCGLAPGNWEAQIREFNSNCLALA